MTFCSSTAPREASTVTDPAYEAKPHSDRGASPGATSQEKDPSALDALSARLSSVTLTSATFHVPGEKEALLGELLTAKEKALQHGEPPFSEVKVRFNVGTQLFYKAPKGGPRGLLTGGPVTFETLRAAKVGKTSLLIVVISNQNCVFLELLGYFGSRFRQLSSSWLFSFDGLSQVALDVSTKAFLIPCFCSASTFRLNEFTCHVRVIDRSDPSS